MVWNKVRSFLVWAEILLVKIHSRIKKMALMVTIIQMSRIFCSSDFFRMLSSQFIGLRVEG